jgi:iron only hydrogenase large subunit-like protein
MINKNNISKIEEVLANTKIKKVAMIAPSFLTDFTYPSIVNQLKALGFNEVVEVTFGAKIVNREYHKILQENGKLCISSTCPGVAESIKNNPELTYFKENIAPVDSPMVAMGKVCRKLYPKYKIFFISPCHMKKTEANNSPCVDYVLDYQQLKIFLEHKNIPENNSCITFDKLYNDYTKIYPLSGGLTKTSRIRKILKRKEYKICDGWPKVQKLLLKIKNNPKKYKNIKFLDVTFCPGGCIGGPCTNRNLSTRKKYKLVKKYMKNSLREKIPKKKKGLFSRIKGMKFGK